MLQGCIHRLGIVIWWIIPRSLDQRRSQHCLASSGLDQIYIGRSTCQWVVFLCLLYNIVLANLDYIYFLCVFYQRPNKTRANHANTKRSAFCLPHHIPGLGCFLLLPFLGILIHPDSIVKGQTNLMEILLLFVTQTRKDEVPVSDHPEITGVSSGGVISIQNARVTCAMWTPVFIHNIQCISVLFILTCSPWLPTNQMWNCDLVPTKKGIASCVK